MKDCNMMQWMHISWSSPQLFSSQMWEPQNENIISAGAEEYTRCCHRCTDTHNTYIFFFFALRKKLKNLVTHTEYDLAHLNIWKYMFITSTFSCFQHPVQCRGCWIAPASWYVMHLPVSNMRTYSKHEI